MSTSKLPLPDMNEEIQAGLSHERSEVGKENMMSATGHGRHGASQGWSHPLKPRFRCISTHSANRCCISRMIMEGGGLLL